MNKRIFIVFLLILALTINANTKKLSRSRSSSSSRGSSRRTQSQPAPTSFSNPQASAPKPTLFGWQEKSASKPSKPRTSDHSYPSSNTGLSGNNQPQKTAYEQNVQKSNAPVQQNVPTNNQMSGHSYPASKGLSGDSGSASGYPQGTGLSGQGTNLNANRPQSGVNSYPSSNGMSGNSAPNTAYGQGSAVPHSNVAPPPYQANYPGNGQHAPGYTNVNNQYQGAPPPYSSGGNYHHPQGPPPPYNSGHGYGAYGNPGGYGSQMPGYYGNYNMNSGKGFGGMSRSGTSLAGVGLAGAGIGTVLTGLALWNLARSTGHHHHTVIYDNRGQPIAVAPDNSTAPVVDPMLGDLVNCTLTITNDVKSEVLAIPCAIATSFTPEADVKDLGVNNNTSDSSKCIVTVVTKTAKEYMTTIPCSILLNTAAENNVTEPITEPSQNVTDIGITTMLVTTTSDQILADQPSNLALTKTQDTPNEQALPLNCSQEEGNIRDPINPCFSVKHNLTVVPIETTVTE